MKAFLGLLSVIAFLLLVSCEQAPVGVAVPDNADNIRNGSISRADVNNTATPITGLTFNACTRELIDFEGTIHTRRVAKEQQDGSTSFSLNLNIKAVGVGRLTGNTYQFIQHQNDTQEYEFGPPYPSVRELVRTVKLVSQGNAADANTTFRLELIVNASGIVVLRTISNVTVCS